MSRPCSVECRSALLPTCVMLTMSAAFLNDKEIPTFAEDSAGTVTAKVKASTTADGKKRKGWFRRWRVCHGLRSE